MNNVNRRALDITLAVEARAKYAAMLSAEDRRRICALSSQDELVALLARSDGWRQAVTALPAVGTTEAPFSAALDQELLADFERLYRTASDTSKDFLRFITLERELKAIKAALRRLAAGGAPAAPESALNAPAGTHDQELNRLRDARSFPELVSLCQKSIYGPALRSMQLDKKTGLPVYAEAVLSLEAQFNRALANYLRREYKGPGKNTLIEAVSFRADMVNVTYLLRLRRFNTPPERAAELLLPLGSVGADTAKKVMAAESDEAAMEVLRASRVGRWLAGLGGTPPERVAEAAEEAYYRRVIHGAPTLRTVYAFLTLKENEAAMLKRAFVALGYGLSPEKYILQ